MAGFFERMLGRSKEPGSANRAKERLQVVLVHDRFNISPERMQMMKDELVAVISKYVSITGDEVEIALEQRDRNQNRLIAEVPFLKPIDPDDPDEDAPYPQTSTLQSTSLDDSNAFELPLLQDPSFFEETRRSGKVVQESDSPLETAEDSADESGEKAE